MLLLVVVVVAVDVTAAVVGSGGVSASGMVSVRQSVTHTRCSSTGSMYIYVCILIYNTPTGREYVFEWWCFERTYSEYERTTSARE